MGTGWRWSGRKGGRERPDGAGLKKFEKIDKAGRRAIQKVPPLLPPNVFKGGNIIGGCVDQAGSACRDFKLGQGA